MKQEDQDFKSILKVLSELHKDYPNFKVGRHLSTALSEYGDCWSMSHKEMLFALRKYQTTISIDMDISSDYINSIIEDAQDLDNILNEDNGYEEE